MFLSEGEKRSPLAPYLNTAIYASAYLVQLFKESEVQSSHQKINTLSFKLLLQFENNCYG